MLKSHIRQASGRSRAPRRVARDIAQTDRENSPAFALGEAPVFRRLAAFAYRQGYTEISPSRIHAWSGESGLLGSTQAPDVEERLLAICALRRQVASRRAVLVLLWASGWHVDPKALKDALLSTVPSRSMQNASDRTLDRLDRLASRKAPRLVRLLRPGRVGPLAVSAAATLVPLAVGALEQVDAQAAQAIERVTGLHRGRSDEAPGATPWLTARPAFAFTFFARRGLPIAVRPIVQRLSAEDIAASREHAHFLIHDLPDVARGVEAMRGRGFAGFHALALLGLEDAPLLALAAVVADRYPSTRRRLSELAEGLGPLAPQARLLQQVVSVYPRQHPDQRHALRRDGLQGLFERGTLRRLNDVDELLHELEVACGELDLRA